MLSHWSDDCSRKNVASLKKLLYLNKQEVVGNCLKNSQKIMWISSIFVSSFPQHLFNSWIINLYNYVQSIFFKEFFLFFILQEVSKILRNISFRINIYKIENFFCYFKNKDSQTILKHFSSVFSISYGFI